MAFRSKHDDPHFELQPFSLADKVLTITGPDELTLYVDFDDVNHYAVETLVPLVVRALNGIPKEEIARAQERGVALQEEADRAELEQYRAEYGDD